ncbi:hypothetical protein KKH23_06960 [Patescibacteria group bacterium]|uniref:Uncharacterized protein n=1 Tax=viral metagenome TaxID=1070528 RepID=A0A6M3M9V4_9ZZZZ|nr:hypothetical protein [Patescibacteria group bacterium]
MPNQNYEEVFKCPCCGMVAPIERLNEDGPFPFEQTTRRFGGKTKLTEEERGGREHERMGRGSGHGKIEYDPWAEPAPEVKEALARRVAQVQGKL